MLLSTQNGTLQHLIRVGEEHLDHRLFIEYVVEALEFVDSEIGFARNEQSVLLGDGVDTESQEVKGGLHEV